MNSLIFKVHLYFQVPKVIRTNFYQILILKIKKKNFKIIYKTMILKNLNFYLPLMFLSAIHLARNWGKELLEKYLNAY